MAPPLCIPNPARGRNGCPLGPPTGKTRRTPIPAFPTALEVIPAAQIDRPFTPEVDDVVLSAEVEATKGEVIVSFKPVSALKSRLSGVVSSMTKAEVFQIRRQLEAEGVHVTRTFSSLPALVGTVPIGVLPRLRRLPYVDDVYANDASTRPSLSASGNGSFGMVAEMVDWGVNKVGAPGVWPLTQGFGARITIIDFGLDSTHLSGDGPTTSPLYVGCSYAAVAGVITSCYQDQALIHGSRVAGTISARNQGDGYLGVAYAPTYLTSIRVCTGTGGCPAGAVLAAIDWTVANGGPRQIVNLSFAVRPTVPWLPQLQVSIQNSFAAGNLLVGTAGNDNVCGTDDLGFPYSVSPGTVCYPGKYTQVIAVSGTSPTDAFAGGGTCPISGSAKSNYGPEVELAAPFHVTAMGFGGSYGTSCGTSFSAPHVTGVAALAWAWNQSFTRDQIRARLTSTALDLGAAGRDQSFGYGRIRAPEATFGILGVSISGPGTPNGSLQTWTANVTNGVAPQSYLWERRHPCNLSYSQVGVLPSYSETTTVGDKFYLRSTVTSGGRTSAVIKLVGGFAIC